MNILPCCWIQIWGQNQGSVIGRRKLVGCRKEYVEIKFTEAISLFWAENRNLSLISSFAPRKSPGLDGLPLEWYHTFRNSLAPLLECVFTAARSDVILPPSIRRSFGGFPKGGKDPRECDAYRPILLMKESTKTF